MYDIVKQIPAGRVATYADIARLAKNPRACRAVARALSNNRDLNTPCHRVVKSDGSLGKYNRLRGLNKESLLKREGVAIIAGRVDLEKYSYFQESY